jgi:hypothetical protein
MLTSYGKSVEHKNPIPFVMFLFPDFNFATTLKKTSIINLHVSTHVLYVTNREKFSASYVIPCNDHGGSAV